jgi:hypothetical protein
MNPVTEWLGRLNRKERFHLLQMVLAEGASPGTDSFRLSDGFRARLGEELRLAVPPDAFAAMDYQLDWIYVALYLAIYSPASETPVPKPAGNWFNRDQEDTDLLVAFDCPDQPNVCHLVLIEAKCGTGWANKQVQSKLCRLQHIHRELRLTNHRGVQFHWVATSPCRSAGLSQDWPDWLDWGTAEGAYHWVEMPVGEHWKAARCDDKGKPQKEGAYWRLRRG